MKNRRFFILFLIMILTATMIAAVMMPVNAKGEEPATLKSELTELFNATNTYNVSSIDLEASPAGSSYSVVQQKVEYDMFTANNKEVMDYAQVSVLTHGLGANAGTWSNAFSADNKTSKFAYSDNSIINRFKLKYGSNLEIIWATVNTINSLVFSDSKIQDLNYIHFYDITNKTGEYLETNEIVNLTDSSKHYLVVFDSNRNTTNGSNDNVYFQLNYALSKIAEDLKAVNPDNKLPKFNLIGHSRGGITNLQYALDHPDMVENLISLGSPLEGSTTALLFGQRFAGNSDGLADIINSDKYRGYINDWNTNYDRLYSKINATAIGSYSSLAFIGRLAHNDLSGKISTGKAVGIDAALVAIGAAKILTDCSLGFIKTIGIRIASYALRDIFPESKAAAALQIFNNEINYDFPSLLSFYNDILVNLDSQLALSYRGFNRRIRKFQLIDDSDAPTNFSSVSLNYIPVPHNLEARDKKIMDYVMEALSYNDSISYEEKTDGTVRITGFKRAPEEGLSDNGATWTIPTVLGGKTVTEISPYAFASVFIGEITKVIVPFNITKIGDGAFWKCTALTEVDLPNTITYLGNNVFSICSALTTVNIPNTLTEIPDGTFAGCKALTTVSIPNGVTKIGSYAFSNCTALTNLVLLSGITELGEASFYKCVNLTSINLSSNITVIPDYCFAGCSVFALTLPSTLTEIGNYAFLSCHNFACSSLPSGLTEIGDGAFMDCTAITSITIPNNVDTISGNFVALCTALNSLTVSSGNTHFIAENGALYNYNKSTLISYVNQTIQSFTLPNETLYINCYAFYCNTALQEVNLNNVEILGLSAFVNCSNLSTISGAKLMNAYFDSFDGTPWKQQNTDEFVRIGKVLFKYNGSTSIIDLSGYHWVSDEAFKNNINVQEIIIDSLLSELGKSSFENCVNLSKITVLNNSNPIPCIGTDCFKNVSENLEIYVPENMLSDYENSADRGWLTSYSYNPIVTEVHYFSNGEEIYSDEAYFGTAYILYSAPGIPGYGFRGWSDNEDPETIFISNAIWSKTDLALNVYANWEPESYYVYLHCNGGGVSQSPVLYTHGDSMSFATPTRTNYIFLGWYGDSALTQIVDQNWLDSKTETFDIYAKWEVIGICGTFYSPVGGNYPEQFNYTNLSSVVLPVISYNNIEFLGWYDGDNGTGNRITNSDGVLITTDLPENINLYAKWPDFTITYNLDGGTNGDNPSTFNFYTGEIVLADATKENYRFIQWENNENAIKTIPEFYSSNITINAIFAQEYHIVFNENGGTATADKYLINGENLLFPTITKAGRFGEWGNNNNKYKFGSTCVLYSANFLLTGTEIDFNAFWFTYSDQGTYHLKIYDSGSTATEDHTYSSIVQYSLTCHKCYCVCGHYIEQAHCFITKGKRTYCLTCGFVYQDGGIIVQSMPIDASKISTINLIETDTSLAPDNQIFVQIATIDYFIDTSKEKITT